MILPKIENPEKGMLVYNPLLEQFGIINAAPAGVPKHLIIFGWIAIQATPNGANTLIKAIWRDTGNTRFKEKEIFGDGSKTECYYTVEGDYLFKEEALSENLTLVTEDDIKETINYYKNKKDDENRLQTKETVVYRGSRQGTARTCYTGSQAQFRGRCSCNTARSY